MDFPRITGLTHRHHVVPAVQGACGEALSVHCLGGDQDGDVPLAILQDAHGPRAQEPAHGHQHHAQDPQQVQAGHVGHPLGRPREEDSQNTATKGREMLLSKVRAGVRLG